MERSEPSLVPEWLRSNGSGSGGGGSAPHFASSQADGPVLALPRRSRSSKSIDNTDSMHSPLLDRSISSNSRRNSNGNGFSQHDRNSYGRPYSSYSRSNRDRDRERSTIADSWNSDFSDPLRGMLSGRTEDPIRRSHSSNSRRQGEVSQRRISVDMRNGIQKNHDNGNGTHSSGIQKVSFERDFPVLGSEDRPRTPDLVRVSSPGLSRVAHSLSIVNPPSISCEAWTSALVEVPAGPGSIIGAGSSPALVSVTSNPASSSSTVSVPESTLSGLKMAEALVQAPTHNSSQPTTLNKDEIALAQSKKLIPMTPLSSKSLVRSSSDKLKPVVTPKNGVHHLSSLQLQPTRGVSVRGDGPNSPSSGKLLLRKPGRENGVFSALNDLLSPTAISNNRTSSGQSTGNPSVSLTQSKNPHNPKILPGGKKVPGVVSNPGAGVDKRTSRSNFFKLVREKSSNNSSGSTEPATSPSLDAVVEKEDKVTKEVSSVQVTHTEAGNELECSGETCTVDDSFSPSLKIDNEEERAFLLSMGWEDNAEGDEDGLTEEEIYACYMDVMKQWPTSRLCKVLQEKIFSHVGSSSSTEANSPTSETEQNE